MYKIVKIQTPFTNQSLNNAFDLIYQFTRVSSMGMLQGASRQDLVPL